MSKLLSITVKGNRHEWSFSFYGDTKYLEEWRSDGLLVDEVSNIIPAWVPGKLVWAWVFLQDVFNFNNPFGKKRGTIKIEEK